MTHVMNIKEVLCMFMTTVIKNVIIERMTLNANITLFEMCLL